MADEIGKVSIKMGPELLRADFEKRGKEAAKAAQKGYDSETMAQVRGNKGMLRARQMQEARDKKAHGIMRRRRKARRAGLLREEELDHRAVTARRAMFDRQRTRALKRRASAKGFLATNPNAKKKFSLANIKGRGVSGIGSSLGAAGGMPWIGAAIAGVYVLMRALRALKRMIGRVMGSYLKEQGQMLRLAKSMRAARGASGSSTDDLIKQANELQDATTYSRSQIMGVQSIVSTFVDIKSNRFQKTVRAALDMASVMGATPEQAASRISKAQASPRQFLKGLGRISVIFRAGEADKIKMLAKTNRLVEAQEMVFDSLRRNAIDRNAEATDNLSDRWKQFQYLQENVRSALGKNIDEFFNLTNVMNQTNDSMRSIRGTLETKSFQTLAQFAGIATKALTPLAAVLKIIPLYLKGWHESFKAFDKKGWFTNLESDLKLNGLKEGLNGTADGMDNLAKAAQKLSLVNLTGTWAAIQRLMLVQSMSTGAGANNVGGGLAVNGMPGGGFGPPVLGGAGAKMARSGASVRKRASQVNTIASIGSSVATAIGGDGGIAQAAPALLEAAIKLLEFANGRDSNGYSFR